ncbi:MAG: glycoside hydrolase N-terminal domain-containing protein [Clostridia bacterium]|nr:glycoside hydrolase N-terminal domain-containing protein [Clostridia bacterium]
MFKKSKNVLKFVTPASGISSKWREGLFTGNGTIGVNVLGSSSKEVVIVNHTDLWWQGNTGVLPDVSDKAKNIKKNLDALSFRDAESVLTNALNAKNYRPETAYPLPVCDFVLTTPVENTVTDYERAVNLETGEINVCYKDRGVRFDRNIFVSRQNNTIFYEITSTGNKKVNIDFTIVSHDKTNNRTANFESFDVNLTGNTKTDKDFVVFTSRNDDGTDFGCVAKVLCFGGVLTKTVDKFAVKGADRLVILAKVFVSAQKEVKVAELEEELSLIKTPYDKSLKEHATLHSKFINSTEIDLGGEVEDNDNLTVLKTKTGALTNGTIEKMYLYGKHLFACSCGNKVSPSGLFNGDYKAYRSTTENYLQLQRLFNFTFKSNLSKCLLPVFDRFYDNMDDYKKNSTRLYGCKGIFIPSLEAPESGLPGSTVPGVVMNYNVASYISSMIYQYFLQTDDLDFIKEKGFEIVEETALFYEDYLKENKNTKMFESAFGYSPFNTPSNIAGKSDEEFSIASNCVCDFVCASHVFSIMNQLCLTLNKEDKEIEKWQKLLEKIPDIEVDRDGFLKEYNTNVFETNHASPYIPHMFPYNIGFKSFENRRDFEDLVANTIKFRYKNCFGKFNSGNLIDMATALSTCGDSNSAFEVLSTLIKNFVTNNLILSSGDNNGMGVGVYESWPSFEIDKNIALCTCLQNMFVNANKNNISLFRNLPTSFAKGVVKNLMLDNQIKVDMDFNLKRGVLKLKLKSPKNTTVNLGLPNGYKKIKGIPADKVDSQMLLINGLSLQANKILSLKIYFKNLI